MGSKASTDQADLSSTTNSPSAYDQSFAVSEDGRPVPLILGYRKVAARYCICPIYGQRNVTKKQKSGK